MAGEKVPSVSVVRRHFQPSLPSFRRFNPSGLDDEAVTTSNGLTTRNYRDVEGQNVRTTITRVGGASTILPSGKRGGSVKLAGLREITNVACAQSPSPKFVCFSSYVLALCLPAFDPFPVNYETNRGMEGRR